MPKLKRGNIRVIFPNFENRACCEKYLKDDKRISSLHLARKIARMFVLGHYMFLKAHSFPENSLLLGTDNVRGQISEHIFAPNRVYFLFTI